MKLLAISILITTLLFSCSKSDRCGCFDSNGKTEIETRNPGQFSELQVDGVFDINLHLNGNSEVKIEAGNNLFKGIETTIENNRLIVRNNNRCNWVRKYNGHIRLDITCDSITYIKLNESCDLICTDTIKANEFKFDNYADISNVDMNFVCNTLTYAVHAGTGESKLHGSVGVCYLYSLGYSYFYMNDLKTVYCFITSNSTGQSYVNVSYEVGASLKNSGNVYYSGNPNFINSTATGTGRLIKN